MFRVQLLVTPARSGVIKFLTFMLQGDGCHTAKYREINLRRTLLSDAKLLGCSSTDLPGVKTSSIKTWLWRKRQQLLNPPVQSAILPPQISQMCIFPDKNNLRKVEYFLVKQIPELHLLPENCFFKTRSCYRGLLLPHTCVHKSQTPLR